ncbi:YncE family protein [Sphingomonas sp. NSE70-1]|uniref:YncE family protein n=1 Tax=Sphingomonas caseinilyticus TaxID=2908205 RepID=A0ABT0RWY3_9SPHN|nr:YncE family protein [Sphingomonas caseinilyticus]MCL6699338.1 YncE family protein [Sphingomonas caseinilyticus]
MLRHAALAFSLAASSIACAAQSPKGPVLLIGNKGEDTVSFVDLGTGTELGRSPTGKMPHEIAISPDGKQAAVVAYGDQTIDLFDIATRTKLKTIDLAPNEGPHGIAWLRDGRIVVTTERSQSLAVVDPAAGKLLSSIKTDQAGTHMVAVTADGTTAYTSNIPAGTVSVLDLNRGKKLRDITVGGRPEGIALSRDELVLWVGDLEGSRVQAFDTDTFDKLAEVKTGGVPIRVAASPDGRWIVTSNLGAGGITVIDAVSRAHVRDVPLSGDEKAGQVTIIFSADGQRLYAAETGSNVIAEVDLKSGTVLRRLPAGKNGDGLAIAPKPQ